MKYKRKNITYQKLKRQKINIIIALLLCLVILSLILIKGCSKRETLPQPTPDPRYLHPYRWENLKTDTMWYHYDDDQYTSMAGIDVSFHQKIIDWKQVKDFGIDFAFIRVGYRGYLSGQLHEDQMYHRNMEEALKNGVKLGVYFFSQAINEAEAIEEAKFVLHEIKDYAVAYPIAYDMERVTEDDRIKNLTNQERTEIARAFCREIKQAGYEPLVYGSNSWLSNNLYSWQLQDEFEFWMAEYHTQQKYPDYPHVFGIWQYSNIGKIPGISVDTDLNIWIRKKET